MDMSDLKPTISTTLDAAAWNAFVEASPDASCFHWHGFGVALQEALGLEPRYFTALQGDSIVGVLPCALVKSRLWGTNLTAMPFCTYGGPAASSEAVRQALVSEALAFARSQNAAHLELRSAWAQADANQPLYVTFTREISEALVDLKAVPQKRRNMVRKGINAGLTASIETDLDVFFHLYAENARAHGTPALPKRYFEVLQRELGDRSDILIVRDAQKNPISGIMNFYHQGRLHAGFAGEVPEARKFAANDFKYWSLMKHAVARGCTVFDFGRSKRGTGSFTYKQLWACQEVPLHYSFFMLKGQAMPERNPNNPTFSLPMKVWAKLPRFVVDRLGPVVIKGLG
jgi:FemAB-related protein (PEP-CTERM system-associated)